MALDFNNLDPPETPKLADDPFCATELEPVQCHMRLDICHDVAFLFLFTRQLATAPIFARTRRLGGRLLQFVSRRDICCPTRRLRATKGAPFACTSRQGTAPRLLRAPTTGLEGLPRTHPHTRTPTDATLLQNKPPCQAVGKKEGIGLRNVDVEGEGIGTAVRRARPLRLPAVTKVLGNSPPLSLSRPSPPLPPPQPGRVQSTQPTHNKLSSTLRF